MKISRNINGKFTGFTKKSLVNDMRENYQSFCSIQSPRFITYYNPQNKKTYHVDFRSVGKNAAKNDMKKYMITFENVL